MIFRNVCYVILCCVGSLAPHLSIAQHSDFMEYDIGAIPKEIRAFKPAPDVRWNRGTITLDSGQRMMGYYSYDHRQQVLIYFDQGKVDALTAFDVRSFAFFDQHLGHFRRFQVLPMKHSRQVFEMLSHGKYRLLRQELNGNAAYTNRSPREKTKFKYRYFVWDGQKVWHYQEFRYNLHAITKKGFNKMIIPNISSNLSLLDRKQIIKALTRLSEEDQLSQPKLALKK